jgi:hypothetical protein
MEVTYPKCKTILNWKNYGVIYHNFDDLYEVYIKTMNCWHCNKEFVSTRDRCLDHNHDNGLFRAIICQSCNNRDSFQRYPNGYSKKEYESKYRKNKEKRILSQKEMMTCLCGAKFQKITLSRHKRTDKHLNNMDKYMENVD